jgi:ribosomal protein L22
VRSSARKARLVCDNIRGKSVTDAEEAVSERLGHKRRRITRLYLS